MKENKKTVWKEHNPGGDKAGRIPRCIGGSGLEKGEWVTLKGEYLPGEEEKGNGGAISRIQGRILFVGSVRFVNRRQEPKKVGGWGTKRSRSRGRLKKKRARCLAMLQQNRFDRR